MSSSTGTVPLSVLIPTKDEIKNLPGCLEALRGWAGEVVVVDSGSRDGTVEAAEAFGATVLDFDYRGGWPKKRQWALDTYAFAHDWILLLDADEILLPAVKQEIEQAIQDPSKDGYWVSFRLHFLGQHMKHGDGTLWKLSLFRRGKGRYEQRLTDQDASMADMEVHEHVIVEGEVGRLKHFVRHESFNGLSRFIEKHNEYSNWDARVLADDLWGEVQPSLLGTQAERRRFLKKHLFLLPGSPLLRFGYVYLGKLGFLDGRAGFVYSVFKGIQTFHIKAKVRELRNGR